MSSHDGEEKRKRTPSKDDGGKDKAPKKAPTKAAEKDTNAARAKADSGHDNDALLKKMAEMIDAKIGTAFQTFEAKYQFEFDDIDILGDEGAPSEISDIDRFIDAGLPAHEPLPSTSSQADRLDVLAQVGQLSAGIEVPQSNEWTEFTEEFTGDESIGPKISEGLAELVNSLFGKRLSDETLAKKMKMFPRPDNCKSMVTPRINNIFWERFTTETRSFDVKMQKTQNCLLKAAAVVISILNDNEMPRLELNKRLVTGLAFLSHSWNELNMRRRDFIRPEMSFVGKHLCSTQIPVTDDLFGGDLHKVMKDITESQRMVNMFRGRGRGRGPRGRGGYGRPYRGGYSSRSRYSPYPRRAPFLGRGQNLPQSEKTPKSQKDSS